MTRPYGVLALQNEDSLLPPVQPLGSAPVKRGAWHLPGAQLWLPPAPSDSLAPPLKVSSPSLNASPLLPVATGHRPGS